MWQLASRTRRSGIDRSMLDRTLTVTPRCAVGKAASARRRGFEDGHHRPLAGACGVVLKFGEFGVVGGRWAHDVPAGDDLLAGRAARVVVVLRFGRVVTLLTWKEIENWPLVVSSVSSERWAFRVQVDGPAVAVDRARDNGRAVLRASEAARDNVLVRTALGRGHQHPVRFGVVAVLSESSAPSHQPVWPAPHPCKPQQPPRGARYRSSSSNSLLRSPFSPTGQI